WPVAAALGARAPLTVGDVQRRFPGLAAGPAAAPLERATLLPVGPGAPSAPALLVIGAGAAEPDLEFQALLAGLLTGAAAEALAAETERRHAAALTEANRELEAFSYSVSHDLRTPLRAIDGFSRILQSDYGAKLDDQGRRYLDRVRAGTQRMGELIDDLLGLARITRATVARERVDLGTISRRIVADLAARDPERQVEVAIGERLAIAADPRLVTVLLENLLGNAWKFSSKRPAARIEVGSQVEAGETHYFVRDNGAGFNMEYAKKLFAPFQRLHAASEFQGTGIGLATVHRIVTRHGGRIWASSVLEEGATFFFTLGEQT
ncbi:MAG TPA: ATP-binding protein, partial [Polyangia bacterium]|nr:ATP-binding protein [Polyangia bacterium]